MCVCAGPRQKTREKLTTDIPETDFGVISNGFFIFSVSYTSTLYILLLEVASMQVALVGVRKTFAFL